MRADVKKQDNGPESSTTVVELIVCQMQYDANLSLAASNILDRVEKRRADRGADLLKLIDKVEVRDRVSCRGPTGSNYVLLVLAVIVVLAFYHGCWAECLSSGAGPPKTGSCTRSVHKSYSTWQLLYDKSSTQISAPCLRPTRCRGKKFRLSCTRRPALLRQYAPHLMTKRLKCLCTLRFLEFTKSTIV